VVDATKLPAHLVDEEEDTYLDVGKTSYSDVAVCPKNVM